MSFLNLMTLGVRAIFKWLCLLDSMALCNRLGGSFYWTERLSLLGIFMGFYAFYQKGCEKNSVRRKV